MPDLHEQFMAVAREAGLLAETEPALPPVEPERLASTAPGTVISPEAEVRTAPVVGIPGELPPPETDIGRRMQANLAENVVADFGPRLEALKNRAASLRVARRSLNPAHPKEYLEAQRSEYAKGLVETAEERDRLVFENKDLLRQAGRWDLAAPGVAMAALREAGKQARLVALSGMPTEDALVAMEHAARQVDPAAWELLGGAKGMRSLAETMQQKTSPEERKTWALAKEFARTGATDLAAVAQMNDQDRMAFLEFVYERTLAQERTYGGKLSEQIARAMQRTVANVEGFVSEYKPQWTAEHEAQYREDERRRLAVFDALGRAGEPREQWNLAVSPNDSPEIKQAKADYWQYRDVLERHPLKNADVAADRLLRDARQMRWAKDPLKSESLVGQGLLEAAEQLPNWAASALLGSIPIAGQAAGLAWWIPQIAVPKLDELRQRGGTIDDTALGLTLVASTLEAAVEYQQVGTWARGLSSGAKSALAGAGKNAARQALASAGKRWAKRIAGMGADYLAEMGEEAVQGLMDMAYKDMVTALNKTAKDVNWEEELQGFKSEMGAASRSMFFMLLPGMVGQAAGGLRADFAAKMAERAKGREAVSLETMARIVAEKSADPAMRRYGATVAEKTAAGQEVEQGLRTRVAEEFERVAGQAEERPIEVPPAPAPPVTAAPPVAEAPQPAAPPSAEAVTAPSGQAAAPAIAEGEAPPAETQAAAPPPVAEGEVGRPAEPLASPLEQPPAAPAAKGEKQPWEMTKDEWHDLEPNLDAVAERKRRANFPEGQKPEHPDDVHRRSVEQALAAGKPVPAEVLAEYADLAKTPVPAGAVEAEPRAEEVAPTAEEAPAREPTEEAGAAGEEYAEHLRVEGREATGRILRAGAAGTYQVRLEGLAEEAADIPLEAVVADQLAEMPDGERIQLLKALEAETGIEQVRKVVQQFRAIAPKLAQRSKVPAMWGISGPAPTAEAGGIAAVQVQELYEKYKKLIPSGVLKGLLKDWVSWKQLNRAGASPELLRDWVKRHEPTPLKAFQIGKAAENLVGKELQKYIDSLKDHLDAPTWQLLAKAYRRGMTARTPAQVRDFLEAVNLAVEKHNHAVAVKGLVAAVKDMQKRGLLPEYQAKLDELLKDVATRKPSPASVRWASGVMAAAEQGGYYEGPPQDVVDKARKVLQDVSRINVRDLTGEEISDLTEALATVARMDALKRRILGERKGRTFADIVINTMGEIKRRRGEKFTADEPTRQRLGALVNVAGLMQLSHQSMVHIMAGDKGIAYETLVGDLRKGSGETVKVWRSMQSRFQAAMKELGITLEDVHNWSDAARDSTTAIGRKIEEWRQGKPQTFTVQTEGGTATMTVAQAMNLLANSRDSDTLREMMSSKGFLFNKAAYGMDGSLFARFDEEFRKQFPKAHALALRMQKIITDPEIREKLNAVSYDLTGQLLAVREDYWPRFRAWMEGKSPDEIMGNFHKSFLAHLKFTKERVGSAEPVRIDDIFDTFSRHVNHVASYIGKSIPQSRAMALLNNTEFQQQMRRSVKYADAWINRMKQSVQTWAGQDVVPQSALDRLVKGVIRRAHVGVLGLKPKIVLYQALSLMNAFNEIAARHLFAAVGKQSNEAMVKEMGEWAPTLEMRVQGTGHDIITPGSGRAGLGELLGAPEPWLNRIGLKAIHWADSLVIFRIWQAAKAEAKDKGLVGEEAMRYAGERATHIVEVSQPTYDALSISELQQKARNNPLLALFLLYRSQSNKNFNQAATAFSDYLSGDDRSLVTLARKTAIPLIGNAVGVSLLAAIYDGVFNAILGDEDEDELEKQTASFLWGTVERTLTQWLGVGDIASMLAGYLRTAAEKKPVFFVPERQNVAVTTADNIGKALYYTYQWLDEEGEKGDKAGLRAADYALRALATGAGIPMAEATRAGIKLLEEK